MMKLSSSSCPNIWSLALHSITNMISNLKVVLFVNVLTPRCILIMHHLTGVYHICLAFLFLITGALNFSAVVTHLQFWVILANL